VKTERLKTLSTRGINKNGCEWDSNTYACTNHQRRPLESRSRQSL